MEFIPLARGDQYLFPYFQEDMEQRKITREYAIDLTGSFLAKCNERVLTDMKDWENHYPMGQFSQGLIPEDTGAAKVTGAWSESRTPDLAGGRGYRQRRQLQLRSIGQRLADELRGGRGQAGWNGRYQRAFLPVSGSGPPDGFGDADHGRPDSQEFSETLSGEAGPRFSASASGNRPCTTMTPSSPASWTWESRCMTPMIIPTTAAGRSWFPARVISATPTWKTCSAWSGFLPGGKA